MASNIIVDKSLDFALAIIEFTELLKFQQKYELARQLFKSGTSIGANINEAQHAVSKADFIHKMKISAKEAQETMYWLTLCKRSKHYPSNDTLIEKLEIIQKILSKIISSTKAKL